MTQVRAQAVVNVLRRGIVGLTNSDYRVTVTGAKFGFPLPVRVYDVTAADQDNAATFCLKHYVEEMDGPLPFIHPKRLIN